MTPFHFLLLVAAGFAGGFFGSAVGSAGLISLPALLFLGLSPHAAIATSRPAVLILELSSAVRYWREGKIPMVALRRSLFLGIFAAIGGAIGARILLLISDQAVRLLLSIVISSLIIFLFTKRNWGMAPRPERQKFGASLALATLGTGIYGGFFGFTFGTFITIVLVAFGYSLLESVGQARVIGALTSLATTIVFLLEGTINYSYALALGTGFLVGGWIGAGVTSRRGSGYIKILMIGVILLSVCKLLFDYWKGTNIEKVF